MATRSIGTLAAFITADSTQFMKEFNKLDRQLARSSKSWTEPGAKLAMGFLGVESAAKAIVREVKDVIQNVERIPGVSPQALDSIVTLRKNMDDAKSYVDRLTASVVGFGVRAAQSVGAGAAMIYNQITGQEDDFSALAKLETPDEIARSKDAGFDDKLAEARKRLSEANKAAALAAADEATKIRLLREESERLEKFSESNSINTLQRLDAQTKAVEKKAEADAKMLALGQKLTDLEKKNAETLKDVMVAASFKDNSEKLSDVRKESNDLRKQIYELSQKDQKDPKVIQDTIEAREKLDASMRRQIPLLEKSKALAVDFGNAFGASLEDAILNATKLTDVIRNLAREILTLFLREQLIKPFASGISSLFSSFFTVGGSAAAGAVEFKNFLGGKAIGGPVAGGSTYMVGEKGPELFVPDSSGRIIPNASLRGGAGSAAPAMQFTYNFQSGVTRQELATMLPELQRVTVASVMEKVQRGGTYRKAFV